ncbi:DUF1415 domain-containing protein [Limnohabitans sp. TS-CS-82]|jgi:hypothetical protein|uniref:DUF1415 domain-containing protein n=1 Tax=Limnohabitans sp. TS-CS-82 TaxID=2094193 RepID=UPI000CF2BAF5|nr:DUF1415 domain-containing protein [Limnohabitans sp. TS-CS-82]PQA85182.1 DUF1415 domain-containing protein [Limnohabitans sp. TS-CS-82]
MTDTLTPDQERTAIEDTQKWLLEAVVGLNLCPFAKSVVVKDMVRYRVCASAEPADVLAMLREELQHLAEADPDKLDTTLLIAPNALPDFLDFNDFLADCDEVLMDLELDGVLQVADFHPLYQFGGTEVEDIENFTNRTPYPTLHLLREASIDKAVEAYPDASLIFERNIEVLNKLGHEGWSKLGIASRLHN